MSDAPLRTEQRTCACISHDAKECYERRYPAPIDDLQRADYDAEGFFGEHECMCVCHDECMDWADEHALLGRM